MKYLTGSLICGLFHTSYLHCIAKIKVSCRGYPDPPVDILVAALTLLSKLHLEEGSCKNRVSDKFGKLL